MCADSCFTLATVVELLCKNGLQFISATKLVWKNFVMACSGNKELENRGGICDLTRVDEVEDECNILVFVLMDQDYRCLIASGLSTAEGKTMTIKPCSHLHAKQSVCLCPHGFTHSIEPLLLGVILLKDNFSKLIS